MNAKAMLRWSVVLSAATAAYWSIWLLSHGSVPTFQQIGEQNGIPVSLPIVISRWWDVVAWPLLICMIKAICFAAHKIDSAPVGKTTVSAFIGVIVGIVGVACTALVAITGVALIAPFAGAVAALATLLLFASLASIAYWGGYHLIESPLRKLAERTEPTFSQGLRWLNGQE